MKKVTKKRLFLNVVMDIIVFIDLKVGLPSTASPARTPMDWQDILFVYPLIVLVIFIGIYILTIYEK